MHGGFGVGPGEKKSVLAFDSTPSSPVSACPEEAAAESLNISFGAGSYARRILERMGWQEVNFLFNKSSVMEVLCTFGDLMLILSSSELLIGLYATY